MRSPFPAAYVVISATVAWCESVRNEFHMSLVLLSLELALVTVPVGKVGHRLARLGILRPGRDRSRIGDADGDHGPNAFFGRDSEQLFGGIGPVAFERVDAGAESTRRRGEL